MASKSDLYAERDGIKTGLAPGRGRMQTKVYLIPCAKCGHIIKRQVYNGDKVYYCDYCKHGIKKVKEKAKQNLIDAVWTKGEQRFEKAVQNIKKQVKNFSDYERAIIIARKKCDYYGSIPEAMVAIELIKCGYKIIPQQKVGPYKVDFCIPDLKMVVEVDGALFHQKKFKGDREAIIQLTLGLDWKITHIPAEEISKRIYKVDEAIKTMLQHQGN